MPRDYHVAMVKENQSAYGTTRTLKNTFGTQFLSNCGRSQISFSARALSTIEHQRIDRAVPPSFFVPSNPRWSPCYLCFLLLSICVVIGSLALFIRQLCSPFWVFLVYSSSYKQVFFLWWKEHNLRCIFWFN